MDSAALNLGLALAVMAIFNAILLGVAFGLCRIFVKGLGALFMALAMIGVMVLVSFTLLVCLAALDLLDTIPPWQVMLVGLFLIPLASTIPMGWLFVRWQKRQQGEAAAKAF